MRSTMRVFVFICCMSILALSSCKEKSVKSDGNITKQEVVIDIYNEIKVEGAIDVVYEAKPDNAPFLEVEADENIIPLIDIEVKGRTLNIKSRESINPGRFTVYTNSPSLKKIETKGASKVDLKGAIAGDEFKLELKGTGNFNADNLIYEKAEFILKGAANMTLGGQIHKAKFEISGSENIKAADMAVNELECQIKGNGDMEVNAIDKMSIDISGRSTISYKGKPQITKQKIKGAGTVKTM